MTLKRKLIISLLTATFCPMLMSAQDNYKSELDSLRNEVSELKEARAEEVYQATQKRLWGYGRYKRISYVVQNMIRPAYDGMPQTEWGPKFGVGLQVGNTYHLPHKPLAGIIKFGIDATWFDVTYTGYKKASFGSASVETPGVTDGVPEFSFPDYYPEPGIALDDIDLGIHQLTFSMGIGPSINIAPFAFSSNKNLQVLKAQVYGHFLMGASAILYKDPNTDETEINFAPLPQGAVGISFNWKQLGIGIEGRWGSAKYKNLVSTSDLEENETENENEGEKPKVTFKNSAFRVYLNFHF